jgi:chitinase
MRNWLLRIMIHWPSLQPLFSRADSSRCYTHVNLAFMSIDPETFKIVPAVPQNDDFYHRFAELKEWDWGTKVMVTLSAWSLSDPGPTIKSFSDIARDIETQQIFFNSVLSFIYTYNLDGLNLHFEIPATYDHSSQQEDFAKIPKLIANLKKALIGY